MVLDGGASDPLARDFTHLQRLARTGATEPIESLTERYGNGRESTPVNIDGSIDPPV